MKAIIIILGFVMASIQTINVRQQTTFDEQTSYSVLLLIP
jgi:hypothetical protein